MQWKPVSPVKTTYLTGKTSKPRHKMYSTHEFAFVLELQAQKDHAHYSVGRCTQRTGRVASCLPNASFC